jgi:octaprenyl-diphosphate synthase
MSRTCISLAEGEILQLVKSFDVEITEEEYYSVIYGKTVALISACCEVGAVIADASPDARENLRRYGEEIGYAFQIVDDCLDIAGDPARTGKPLGGDLKEGKVTLPLILTLQEASGDERKAIKEVILAEEPPEDGFERVKGIVDRHRGVERSIERAWEHVKRAMERIAGFRECPERDYLEGIARFIVERDF